MSVADLESIYQAAQAALAAADYDGAIRQALLCKLRLATTPNTQRLAGSMAWANAQSLDQFITEVRQLKRETAVASVHGSGLFQTTKINYQRPDPASAFE